jgi:hypothetical protein
MQILLRSTYCGKIYYAQIIYYYFFTFMRKLENFM